jgi:hypothetical protein
MTSAIKHLNEDKLRDNNPNAASDKRPSRWWSVLEVLLYILPL